MRACILELQLMKLSLYRLLVDFKLKLQTLTHVFHFVSKFNQNFFMSQKSLADEGINKWFQCLYYIPSQVVDDIRYL